NRDARRATEGEDLLPEHVGEVELALLEVAAAQIEVRVVGDLHTGAEQAAIVGLADADDLDLAGARGEDLLHLNNLRRFHAAVDVEVRMRELQLEAGRAPLDTREDGLVDARVSAAP